MATNTPADLDTVARLAAPDDNVAVAVRALPPGLCLRHGPGCFVLAHAVPEGHRFAVLPIARGAPLLSWGLPFGWALRPLAPGTYVCNRRMLAELRSWAPATDWPVRPNFRDHAAPFAWAPGAFVPGPPPADLPADDAFAGLPRPGRRGIGTRNYIVVLGVNARAGVYAEALAAGFPQAAREHPGLDGVVAVAHTEGSAPTAHNLELVLRTLAGLVVHPNVGAVLILDTPGAGLSNQALRSWLAAHDYDLAAVPHHFLSLGESRETALAAGRQAIAEWLAPVAAARRQPCPLSGLKVALQCGGSDAFSGISGNPLAGAAALLIAQHGGAANLAETNELTGAETYLLQNVRDLATAERFLVVLERFRAWAARHGHTLEDNPSSGNLRRGLYNITLKSIGAARKRAPALRLDDVLEYAEPLRRPGLSFMDSPGNDLESVAGQVASGCNLIYFVTGNGSVTNFPFVPTLKFITTTGRYRQQPGEMDVNAGRYLDGTPLAELAEEVLALSVRVAGGERVAGERAGFSQVQLWRNWLQPPTGPPGQPRDPPVRGRPLRLRALTPMPGHFMAVRGPYGWAGRQVALILPASLCAAAVARALAAQLAGTAGGLPFVALPHTEGCGAATGHAEALPVRTLIGYLRHPAVRLGAVLEHGCEKTHNVRLRQELQRLGVDPDDYGWASIQGDGGSARAMAVLTAWFQTRLQGLSPPVRELRPLTDLSVGLVWDGPPANPPVVLAELARRLCGAGATVILPWAPGLADSPFAAALRTRGRLHPTLAWGQAPNQPTLAWGQAPKQPGLHSMDWPGLDPMEAVSGLGAAGVQVALVHLSGPPLPAHPLVPLLQVTDQTPATWVPDLDSTTPGDWFPLLLAAAAGDYCPKLLAVGHVAVQFTRGRCGISM